MKPKLIVVAGPNGAGKTTITNEVLVHQWIDGCTYINPDIVAKEMFGDWNSECAVLNAAEYCKNLREQCLLKGQSMCFETVLSAPDKIEFVKRAKKAGFFIRLFFVGTASPVINAARVAARVMDGGHDVPIQKIISRYTKSIANCCVASKIVNRIYVYDNTADFTEPKLLFRATDGIIKKTYSEIPKWANTIYESICPEESIES